MTWWLLGAVAGAVLLAVAWLSARGPTRDYRQFRRIAQLHREERHDAVLLEPMPARVGREQAAMVRASSAVLCGRYALALSAHDEALSPTNADEPIAGHMRTVRVVALMGLGRYDEASRLLGDGRLRGFHRHLRAQIAVETGDDTRARALLAEREPDQAGEAGRLRILGDLAVRRGSHGEADSLLEEALARYDLLGEAYSVDLGYCLAHQAELRVRTARAAEAIELVARALDCMRSRPHHASGLAYLEAIAAEACAVAGREDDAHQRLARAEALAEACAAPPLTGRVASAAAEVARAAGDSDAALAAYERAIGLHESVGERPEADRLRERLAGL